MEQSRQIFQSGGKGRWKKIIWTGRLILILVFGLVVLLLITIYIGSLPSLPNLESKGKAYAHAIDVSNPLVLKNQQNKKFAGFRKFLLRKLHEDSLHRVRNASTRMDAGMIRAAFYVPWDASSQIDLARHGSKLNMIFPEWYFVDTIHPTIDNRMDSASLGYMRKCGLKILPIFSNYNSSKNAFDRKLIQPILRNAAIQEVFIDHLVLLLKQNGFAGINIDFEELTTEDNSFFVQFERKLRSRFQKDSLLLTTDIPMNNDSYDLKALGEVNDYVVAMAYDEHSDGSGPGPISGQKWIEKSMDEVTAMIPPEKVILGVAGYGARWNNGHFDESVSFGDVMNVVNESGGNITFDDNSYNLHYAYSTVDEDDTSQFVRHDIWFTDAATIFNVLRFSDDFPLAGTALWRLGSEDERMWNYYDRNLSDTSLIRFPFDYSKLEKVPRISKVDFIGEGEVLDIIKGPHEGEVTFDIDSTEKLIAEENYVDVGSGYLIRKFAEDTTRGRGHKLILTFDDGPSAEWTPRILSILEKEKVPATFFVVGIQAQQNIPILQREFRDGFEIGNHTYTHHNIAEMSLRRASLEMELTRLLIESVTGHSTVLFRAPYNADSQPETFEELAPIERSRLENYLTINEGIDPRDWEKGVVPDSVVSRVISAVENENASIILLHDAGGESREATVEALPRIIDYFKEKGYVFTTVGGLMGKSRDELMPLVANKRDRWINSFNFLLADGTYWSGKLLFSLFLIAIILSIGRMLFMIIMASLQRRKDQKAAVSLGNRIDGVSIIIPAYNEEVNCERTVMSMLNQDYPLLEVIFVDDGSKDATYSRVQVAFENNEKVKVFTKPNGGKASALNLGISMAQYSYIVCVDADTQLKKDAVSWLMSKFESEKVAAVAGNVKVGNEVNMLTRWQSIEYITSQNFDRRAFDLLNCITVVPGAIGAFRKEAVLNVGGFSTDTLAEDCDLTMRLLRDGNVVRNCTEAISYTEAPETFKQFFKQRFRWSFGVMQCFWKHRYAIFNPRYGNFGMIAMPNILIFQIVLTILAPLADLILLLSIIFSVTNIIVLSMPKILLYYFIFTMVDVAGAALAFAFEKENPKKLFWILPQRLIYRQMMYLILLKSLKRALKGEIQHWGSLVRTGNVKPSGTVTS